MIGQFSGKKAVFQAESRLIDFCAGLDSDGSGSLSINEFLKGFHNNSDFRQCLEVMHVTESDMFMIFNICDEDDSGDVDYREFVEQLRRIKHSGEQMLLHYVTDIRHLVNKIRPECLKSAKNVEEELIEQKRDQSKEGTISKEVEDSKDKGALNDNLGQASSSASEPLPPVLEEIFAGNDVLDSSKMEVDKLIEKTQDQVTTQVNDMVRKEKLERIQQINEDLVAIMSDLATQSKVQTGLLNTLVDGFQVSAARGSKDDCRTATPNPESAGQTDEKEDVDPDMVRPSANAAPSFFGGRSSAGCCARAV